MPRKTEITGPVFLHYVGPNPADGYVGALPLPEGWPAADHEEADLDVVAEKLASGAYAATPGESAEPVAEPGGEPS